MSPSKRRPSDIPGALWSYRFGQWLGRRVVFPPLFRFRIKGLSNVPSDGAFVLAANHSSNFDPIVTGTIVPRPITFAAKRELLDAPLMGFLYRLWGAIPVQRDGMDLAALRAMLRVLRAGGIIGMFPEGTRSRDGVLRRPVGGAAYLAVKSRVPIVPVGIRGIAGFGWRRRLRRGRIPVHLSFGPAFVPDAPAARLNADSLTAAGDQIMRRIGAQLPDVYHGPYAGQIGTHDG